MQLLNPPRIFHVCLFPFDVFGEFPITERNIKTKTRQFSKRQMTWFRKYAQAQWIELQPDTTAIAVCEQLAGRGLV